MANFKYYFLEQGGTPDVFSHDGKCWKKLTKTASTGEVLSNIDGIFASTEECICDSGNTTPAPITPECDNQLLNVQSLTSYPRDYSNQLHDIITVGSVTHQPSTNLGPQIGSMFFDNSSRNNPSYLTLDNSSAGYSRAPDLPADYSIQYWINTISIPHQHTDGKYLGVVIDGRAVGTTTNNNELVQYVERAGDGYRLHHGATTEPSGDWLISNSLEYNINYQVVVSRKDGVEKMYISGEFHAERNSTLNYNNKNLMIGQHSFNFTDVNRREGFHGYLQDIRVSNIATHYCAKHTVDKATPELCNEWYSVPSFEYGPGQPYHVVVQASSVGYNYIVSGYSHYRYQKIYIDGVNVLNASPYRGMLISKLREINGVWELVEYFGDTQDFWSESNVNQAQALLQSFEDGEMLVLNTSDEPYASGYTSRLYDELESFGARSSQYSALNNYRSSYLLISIKGGPLFQSVGSNGGAPLAHTVYLR